MKIGDTPFLKQPAPILQTLPFYGKNLNPLGKFPKVNSKAGGCNYGTVM